MPNADFQAAVDRVNGLSKDPGNDTKLRLYALYKQATEGDVAGKRPGFTNPVGRAKHDAWSKLKGTPSARPRRPTSPRRMHCRADSSSRGRRPHAMVGPASIASRSRTA